ncbi:facilitated trehalose transporter Tret1-like isoform X2 [Ostrinia nubilalis]
MDEYKEVPTSEKDEILYAYEKKKSWKPLLRQLFIASGLWTPYFAVGLSLGTPTVYVPQARKQANSTDAVSVEMASWLSSLFGFSSLPFVFILAILMTRIGRKKSSLFVSISLVLISIGYYLTSSPVHLLITSVIQGVPNAATVSVSILSTVEYTSPKVRGVLLTIKTATVFWALWIANTIGTYADWRYICVPSFINALYSLTVVFWPESPMWLASQGRIEECKKVHRSLKGCDVESERELQKLIEHQMEVDKKRLQKKDSYSDILKDRVFYIPVTLSCVMMCTHLLSGKQICMMYALDVLTKITKSEDTAYSGMLLLDGVTVLCMYIGCGFSKVLTRRTLLFTFGSLAVFFLFALSLYLYLCHLEVIVSNNYIPMSLLVAFSMAIGIGPIILGISLYGELIPIKYKGESIIVTSLFFFLLQATLFKVSPYVFDILDLHGMFFVCGICVTISLSILYKYLPETKDRTLQEIEEYFKKR